MKIAAGFLYVFWNIVYLSPLIPNIKIWGSIDRVLQFLFLSVLCYFIQEYKKNTEDERLFFQYLKWLTFINSIYLSICIYRGKTYAIYNTPIFAYILGIGFIAFLVNRAINNKK